MVDVENVHLPTKFCEEDTVKESNRTEIQQAGNDGRKEGQRTRRIEMMSDSQEAR